MEYQLIPICDQEALSASRTYFCKEALQILPDCYHFWPEKVSNTKSRGEKLILLINAYYTQSGCKLQLTSVNDLIPLGLQSCGKYIGFDTWETSFIFDEFWPETILISTSKRPSLVFYQTDEFDQFCALLNLLKRSRIEPQAVREFLWENHSAINELTRLKLEILGHLIKITSSVWMSTSHVERLSLTYDEALRIVTQQEKIGIQALINLRSGNNFQEPENAVSYRYVFGRIGIKEKT